MRFPLLLAFATIGCGVDSATANGELGRMTFTLVSDYYVDETELTESSIVTGHEQFFGVELTEDGQNDADTQADEIEYVVTPDDGVTISQSGPDRDAGNDDQDAEIAGNFDIKVRDPGEYQLEARLNGETFDRIQLTFDRPNELELTTFLRSPGEDDFRKHTGDGATVEAGTQLAWLPIPLDINGERLLGDIEAEMSASPENMVVEAVNVEHVNEDEVQTFFGAPSLYFINVGEVAITIGDTENPAVGVANFTVTELDF
ncbi:hypothetical protein LBMAG42_28160 [Deltaproteobacteria bacterium]|nr:hypothetical protein LBMAG42_28160 [Deltaproteobacteria bacterium]